MVVTPAEFRAKMSQGVELSKFNKWGWSQKRSVLIEHMEAGERMFWQKPGQNSRRDTESSIKIRDVKDVRTGMETDMLRKKGKKGQDHLYFSVIAGSKELNFEAANREERDWFVSGFRAIMNA